MSGAVRDRRSSHAVLEYFEQELSLGGQRTRDLWQDVVLYTGRKSAPTSCPFTGCIRQEVIGLHPCADTTGRHLHYVRIHHEICTAAESVPRDIQETSHDGKCSIKRSARREKTVRGIPYGLFCMYAKQQATHICICFASPRDPAPAISHREKTHLPHNSFSPSQHHGRE